MNLYVIFWNKINMIKNRSPTVLEILGMWSFNMISISYQSNGRLEFESHF